MFAKPLQTSLPALLTGRSCKPTLLPFTLLQSPISPAALAPPSCYTILPEIIKTSHTIPKYINHHLFFLPIKAQKVSTPLKKCQSPNLLRISSLFNFSPPLRNSIFSPSIYWLIPLKIQRILVFLLFFKKEEVSFSPQKRNALYVTWQTLANATMVITLQYLSVSNQQDVRLKFTQCCLSILCQLRKKVSFNLIPSVAAASARLPAQHLCLLPSYSTSSCLWHPCDQLKTCMGSGHSLSRSLYEISTHQQRNRDAFTWLIDPLRMGPA